MQASSHSKLIRALGLSAIIIYGVGDILGAGIYAIIGKIAGHAGPLTWLSFAIVLTVFSFSCVALINIKWKERRKNNDAKIFRIPMFVPWLAVMLNMMAIAFLPTRNILLAAAFIGVGLIVGLVS